MTEFSQSLGKEERVKSKTTIDKLFKEGKSIFVHPLKFIYVIQEKKNSSDESYVFGVTIPKRLHKKAVTRNLLKRRVREAYRKNKPELTISTLTENQQCVFMYIHVDKQVSESKSIEKSIGRINKKLEQALSL